MAARQRKTTESLKQYHRNLISEQNSIDARLSDAYGLGRQGSIIKRALNRFFPKKASTSFANPNRKVLRAHTKAQRIARRANRS